MPKRKTSPKPQKTRVSINRYLISNVEKLAARVGMSLPEYIEARIAEDLRSKGINDPWADGDGQLPDGNRARTT